jgi:hypothetical protein
MASSAASWRRKQPSEEETKEELPAAAAPKARKSPEELEAMVEGLQRRVDELELRLQQLEDLNLFAPYVTLYYVEIFKDLRWQNLRSRGGFCSWIYSNWIELFQAAQSEQRDFQEQRISSRPLNDSIAKSMQRIGGMHADDWDQLQIIRRARNNQGHPRPDNVKAQEAVEERWKDHSAHGALTKLMRWVNNARR